MHVRVVKGYLPCKKKGNTFVSLPWPGQCGCYACHKVWTDKALTVPRYLRNPEAA
jgi:hypothetical protein